MAGYVDGFVIPVPKRKVNDYKKIARICAKVWMDHGALSVFECMGDDVKKGKTTSFPQSVKLKKGEVVFFSYITYKSRASRDRVNKLVFEDPRLKKIMNNKTMPFDTKRMIWGGFKPVVKYQAT